MTNILLLLILGILCLDFCMKYGSTVKSKLPLKKKKKERIEFWVRKKTHGDRVADDLEKITS